MRYPPFFECSIIAAGGARTRALPVLIAVTSSLYPLSYGGVLCSRRSGGIKA